MAELDKIILFIQIIFFLFQLFFLFDLLNKNSTRYNYKGFMNKIINEIVQNSLNSHYKEKFEKVFYRYWDHAISVYGLRMVGRLILNSCIGIFSLISIIINKKSFYAGKVNYFSFGPFTLNIILSFLQYNDAINNENGKLDLSESELNQFGNLKQDIYDKLAEVQNRIYYLKLYSLILFIISFIHIILNALFCVIIKRKKKPEIITLALENIENYPQNAESVNINSEYQKN